MNDSLAVVALHKKAPKQLLHL